MVVRVFLIIFLHDAYPKSVVSSATDLHGTSGGECYHWLEVESLLFALHPQLAQAGDILATPESSF